MFNIYKLIELEPISDLNIHFPIYYRLPVLKNIHGFHLMPDIRSGHTNIGGKYR